MKKIVRIIILIVIFIILIYSVNGIYNETKIKQSVEKKDIVENIEENMQEDTVLEENNISTKNEAKEENQIKKEKKLVQEEYKGYRVSAKLKIKKLNIDTCVLKDYTENAMEICVTKFYGPEPNEVGNFCITGHNYITKNMFGYLYTLKIGDTFSLTDNKNGIVEYEIYDKYKAKPTDTYGLSQRTEGRREVTLVTCCNYSNERLVIKAKEIKDSSLI